MIKSAINEIQRVTCITFVESKNDPRRAEIFSGTGCSSDVGRRSSGPRNKVSLNKENCLEKRGTVIHEFLHTLGFFHMQSASDRDNYVRVIEKNIKPQFKSNFDKYSNARVSHFGSQYDIDSIMHYPKDSFSRNGKNTLETLNRADIERIGQRERLTAGDIARINTMYGC